jgi:hypothetical protein
MTNKPNSERRSTGANGASVRPLVSVQLRPLSARSGSSQNCAKSSPPSKPTSMGFVQREASVDALKVHSCPALMMGMYAAVGHLRVRRDEGRSIHFPGSRLGRRQHRALTGASSRIRRWHGVRARVSAPHRGARLGFLSRVSTFWVMGLSAGRAKTSDCSGGGPERFRCQYCRAPPHAFGCHSRVAGCHRHESAASCRRSPSRVREHILFSWQARQRRRR